MRKKATTRNAANAQSAHGCSRSAGSGVAAGAAASGSGSGSDSPTPPAPSTSGRPGDRRPSAGRKVRIVVGERNGSGRHGPGAHQYDARSRPAPPGPVAPSEDALMAVRVPFNDLGRRATALTDRLAAVTSRVVNSGWYLLGPETE